MLLLFVIRWRYVLTPALHIYGKYDKGWLDQGADNNENIHTVDNKVCKLTTQWKYLFSPLVPVASSK
jgi:hypothetical protein